MLDRFRMPMKHFKQERTIRVYIPTDYESTTKTYPVLYMHDGQNVFEDSEAIGGVSLGLETYLESNNLKVIVVAIDQSQDRMNEYTPWEIGEYSRTHFGPVQAKGGKGEPYITFIVEELIPYINQNYRTNTAQTAIAGISLGGLISVYAAICYPNLFPHVVALSSAFFRNQEGLEALIEKSDLSKIKSFYMDCGSQEGKADDRINRNFVISNQAIFDLIQPKLPEAEFHVVEGVDHHYDYFKERIPALFTFLKK